MTKRAFRRVAYLLATLAIFATGRVASAQWADDKGLVLKGKIVTMDEKNTVIDGELLIQGGVVKAMGPTVAHPPGAIVVQAKGAIFPSLMNLHNHTAYNIEPLFPITKPYQNRDQWPTGDAYANLVKLPKHTMEGASTVDESVAYAEVMQIMGGTTVVQGSPQVIGIIRQVEGKNFQGCKTGEDVIGPDLRMATDDQRAKIASLDGWFFHLAEGLSPKYFSTADLEKNPLASIEHEYADMKQILISYDCSECGCEVYNGVVSTDDPDPKKAAALKANADRERATVRAKLPAAEQARLDKAPADACLTVLDANGKPANTVADVKTFCGHTKAQHPLTTGPTAGHPHALGVKAWSKIIGIHCAGLTEADFADWQTLTGGPKVVWSPLSNLMLYGQTTDVPAAIKHNGIVALGTDWTPSGSKNLLWELKVADQVNKKTFNGALTDTDLVALVTRNPAKLLNWSHVGTIKVGQTADLVMVDLTNTTNAYRNLIEATETNVQLVTVGGDPRYGDESILKQLKLNPDKSPRYEILKESPAGRSKALDMKFPGAPNQTFADMEKKIDDALAGAKAQPRTPLNEALDDAFWKYWTLSPDKGGNYFMKGGVLAGVVDVNALAKYRKVASGPPTSGLTSELAKPAEKEAVVEPHTDPPR
jgi:cytosine/adenosine deaminase-related metal-dependent hydrolase